ncbi:hypothetical protein BJ085DRAFT_40321 [Dimargaris cristalligena]|uniref:Uncharacterized protein n=1 Tax=Dimargaris cristalligena TaxID=215637 RepID=A0A4P9ZU41_9FUNG|nr:hypothetical protein BJ085DRAFT_40321 [Dimargaris cristalligena]|eukprot:RKP37064.1 hypothetical protein BJ085DRAFT_40321 [Dimargaris cristalligena]
MLPNTDTSSVSSTRFRVITLAYGLQLALAHRDFPRATRILAALYSFGNAPNELLWKPAMMALRQNGSFKETEAFLERHIKMNEPIKAELVQELINYRLDRESPADVHQEKYDDSQVKSTPLLQGYMGTLLLANHDRSILEQSPAELTQPQFPDPLESLWYFPLAPPEENAFRSIFGLSQSNDPKDAINHFEKALLAQPLDFFLPTYLHALLRVGRKNEAKKVILDFCFEFPDNLNGHRLALSLLHADLITDRRAWVKLAQRYVELDPVSDWERVFIPLCSHYESLISAGYHAHLYDLIHLVVDRIEATQGEGEGVWLKLADIYYCCDRDMSSNLPTYSTDPNGPPHPLCPTGLKLLLCILNPAHHLLGHLFIRHLHQLDQFHMAVVCRTFRPFVTSAY